MTNELAWMRRQILILSSGVLAVLVILWLIVPTKAFVAGFILGGVISLYNVLYLARRVRVIGQMVVEGSARIAGAGLINRILMVVFAAILAYRFPEWIDYRSLILGLPMSYMIMVLVAILYVKKERTLREGRDVLGTDSEN